MRRTSTLSVLESSHCIAAGGFCPEIESVTPAGISEKASAIPDPEPEPESPESTAPAFHESDYYSEFFPEPAIETLNALVGRSMQGGNLLEEPNPADEFYKTWFGTASYGAGGNAGPDAMSSAGDGSGNSITINYDNAGYMLDLTVLSTSDGSKVFTYEWDEFNRLKYAKRTGTNVSDYEALYNYSLSTLFLRKECLPPGRFSAKIDLYGSVRIGKIDKKLVDQAVNYETTLYVNDAVIRKFLALSVFSTKKSLPPGERFSAKIVREERLIRKSASLTEYELVRYILIRKFLALSVFSAKKSLSPGERFSAKIVLDGSRLLRLDWNNTGSDNTFTRRWMHPDHLGTASLISNDAGDKESFGSQHFSCGKSLPPGERFSAKIVLDESITIYLPYGAVPSASLRESTLEEKSETGFRDPYGFTGKELEVDLGIMYFGARWYNPQLGRWLSPDPLYLVSTAKNAERQQNLYEYASNNPWTFVDPNGLDETADQYKKTVNDVRGKNNPDIAGSKDRLDGKNSESRLKELHDSINHGKKFLGVGNVSFIISTAWSMAIGIIESDVTSNKFTKNGNTFAVGYLQMSRYELLKAMNTNHDFKKYVNDWLAKNPKPNKRPSHFRPIKGNTPEISAQNDALWKNVTKEEWALTNGKINILAFMINVNNNLRQVINNSCSGRFCFSDRKNLNLNSPFMSILKLATSGNIKGLQMILSLMHNSTGYWQLQFSRRSSFLSNPQGFVNIINNYEGPDKKASFRNAKKVFTYVRQISILISIIEKNIK